MSTETGTSKRAHKRLDGGHDALELLGLGDLVPRPRLHSADVEQIGAVDDELLGLAKEVVEAVVAALVEERVGRAVEDAHHERPGGDVVPGVAELHLHGGEPSRRHRRLTHPVVAAAATTHVDDSGPGVDLDRGQRLGRARDCIDPPDRERGRRVHHARDALAEKTGRQSGDETPHHQRADHGRDEQVRGKRGQRQRPEHWDGDRRDAELRGAW